MKVGDAIAEIMKREGIEILCGYPVNHLLEYAAKADIRPIIVRQERIGLHMADAISRVTSGNSRIEVERSCRRGDRNGNHDWRDRAVETQDLNVQRRPHEHSSLGLDPTGVTHVSGR